MADQQMILDRVEYLSAHRNLDKASVPRVEKGVILSLWGRIILYKSQALPLPTIATMLEKHNPQFDLDQ